jgi:predicted  nucleic acid-binding Zn-ribbon protein
MNIFEMSKPQIQIELLERELINLQKVHTLLEDRVSEAYRAIIKLEEALTELREELSANV